MQTKKLELQQVFRRNITEILQNMAKLKSGNEDGQGHYVVIEVLTLSRSENILAETIAKLTGDLVKNTPRLSVILKHDGLLVQTITTGRHNRGKINSKIISYHDLQEIFDYWFFQALAHQYNSAASLNSDRKLN